MDSTTAPPNRFASVTGGVILGLVIAGMGALFCYALMIGFNRAQETRTWTPTPCEIVRSEVIENRATPNSPLSYVAKVEYTYSFDGKNYVGKNVNRVDGPTNHREKAEATVAEWPVGKASCFVNPADPEKAVLKQGTRAAGYSVWFPGLFVIGGLGIVVGAIRGGFRRDA